MHPHRHSHQHEHVYTTHTAGYQIAHGKQAIYVLRKIVMEDGSIVTNSSWLRGGGCDFMIPIL